MWALNISQPKLPVQRLLNDLVLYKRDQPELEELQWRPTDGGPVGIV